MIKHTTSTASTTSHHSNRHPSPLPLDTCSGHALSDGRPPTLKLSYSSSPDRRCAIALSRPPADLTPTQRIPNVHTPAASDRLSTPKLSETANPVPRKRTVSWWTSPLPRRGSRLSAATPSFLHHHSSRQPLPEAFIPRPSVRKTSSSHPQGRPAALPHPPVRLSETQTCRWPRPPSHI